MIELDENYTENMWFSDIDDKVFAFKLRVHNWLKEGEKLVKLERKSKSSGSKSSKSSSTSSSRSSKLSVREKAIQEKVPVAELQMEASFKKKKRDSEWVAESLRLEKEMAKARTRVKIYEHENQDQDMVFKTEEHKQDNITYHQETTKGSEINQYSDPTKVGMQNVYSSIPRKSYDQKFEKINIPHAFRQALRASPVEVAFAYSERAVEDKEMGKMLCQLVKQQSAPAVNI